MIQNFLINNSINNKTVNSILQTWSDQSKKVFHIRANLSKSDIRDYYENFARKIGELKFLAEDVSLGDREKQRANKIWMEVRYDSSIKDAYRHSSNPQPLHTDGSYISNYPNSTLMCCVSNSAIGGETTFLNVKELVQILKMKNPELLEFLLTTKVLHERSGDRKNKKILEFKNGKYNINFNYYCISKKNSKKIFENVNFFFNLLNNSKEIKETTMAIKLNVGDAIFWKDSEVLHGRNGFYPTKTSDRFLWKCALEVGQKKIKK